jgi:hypothetical protein
MRESPRNINLILEFGREQYAGIFSKCWQSEPQVHGNIQRFALGHAAKFRLRTAQLIMETSQSSLGRARVVVLDKNIGDAKVGKLPLVVCLQEKAASVTDYFWLKFRARRYAPWAANLLCQT